MVMIATVIRTEHRSLLVRNSENDEEVLVFFQSANRFRPGDRIRISYDGKMTFSIPPQITAAGIQRIQGPPHPPQHLPSELRAVILQKGRAFLLVRDIRDDRQMRVNYPYAHHFCVGQQIIIRHESIVLGNTPQLNATDILPVC